MLKKPLFGGRENQVCRNLCMFCAETSTFRGRYEPCGPVVWWPGGPVAQRQPVLVVLEALVTAAFMSGKKDEATKFVIKQGGS